MATRIKLRRDTAANWLSQNPILAQGETGFETDTRMMKLGDGATAWKDLKYAVTGDLQVTGDTVHGDTSVSLSSGIGNSENWILLTQANVGDVNSPTNSYAVGVAYDSQGNLFSSYVYGNPDGGAALQKTSPSGEVLWNNYYNGYNAYGYGMAVDRFDNVIMILGEQASSSDDIVLIKVSGVDGSIVWQKYLNSYGDYNDQASCIDTDNEGNIFITGKSNNAGPQENNAAFVAKFSSTNGDLIWSKQYNVDGFNAFGTGLTTDRDGNVCIVGSYQFDSTGFVNVFKLNGMDGQVLWQGKVLNAKFDSGNNDGGIGDDIHFGHVYSSDVTSDSQGNFYQVFSWFHEYYPGGMAMVVKYNGVTGKSEWAHQLSYDDYAQTAGSVICDELNNVYVSASLIKYKSNYDNGNYNRLTQHITKINSTGSIIWQRWLDQEQAVTMDSKNGFFDPPYGQSIRVNKDYIAVVGNYWVVTPYGYTSEQNWYNQHYLAQLNRDGTEFNIGGWKFEDASKDTQAEFTSIIEDSNNWIYDPNQVLNFNVTITNGDVAYQQNTDVTDLVYVNRSNVNKVTFSQKTLTLPPGGAVELGREKLGYLTAIGSFDGVEGGNYSGNVWLNGSARDDSGGTYAAGGWYDNTGSDWNNWQNYRCIPMVFKTDAEGKLIWQAGNALDQNYSNPDLVDVVYHSATNTVITLGNDGELDGHEGFNVLYLDADTGSMKQSITHIRPAEGSNDIYPTTLNVMSDGTPVVGGYITGSQAVYSNVTSGASGLTGSTNSGTLVVLKSKFTVDGATEYPTEDGTWYLYPGGSQIISVNRYGHDDAQPTITYTGTLGSGAVVDVTIAGGVPSLTTVNVGGSGYKAGQAIKVLGTGLGGTSPTNDLVLYIGTVNGSGAITTFSGYDTSAVLVDGTYTSVATTALAGTGIAGSVQYAPEGTVYTSFTITSGGTYYGVGDTFTILGTALGGATPANDLTITVTAINDTGSGNGQVTTTSLSGTPQSTNIKLYGGNNNYTQAGTYNVQHDLATDGFIWTPMWSKVFGTTGNNTYDDLHGLAIDSSDNVIVSGYSNGTGITGSWNNSGWLQTGIISKFSSEGTKLWTKSIDGSEGQSTVWSVATDMDDNIYSVMTSGYGSSNPYITKLTPDGTYVWQQSVGLYDSYNGWSIAVADNGDVMIAGYCYGSWLNNSYHHNDYNILIVKFDKDGNKLFSRLLWSTDRLRQNYNDTYSNHLTIKGDRFSLVGYSNDPGDQNYQGIVIDLPLDGTGVGDYGDFHYEEVETNVSYRFETNQISGSHYAVTNVTTMAIRPYTFVSAPYVDANAWRNVSIYGNRTAQTYPIYKQEGGEIKGVAKITFEDGSVQTSSQQGLPQVPMSQVNTNGYDYYLRPEDNGKHVYKLWNSAVVLNSERQYLPVGYAITIITSGNPSGVYCENNNDNLIISGTSGSYTHSATIPYYTMATLVKIAGAPGNTGTWMLAGAGITSGY